MKSKIEKFTLSGCNRIRIRTFEFLARTRKFELTDVFLKENCVPC